MRVVRSAKATILDIARKAGVSKSTVSLVLQGSGLVRPETTERVRSAMEDVGYVYNRGAANLRRSRSNVVGMVINDLMNPFFVELAVGIERAFQGAGIVPFIAHTSENPIRQEEVIKSLMEQGVAGTHRLARPGDGRGCLRSSAVGGDPRRARDAADPGEPRSGDRSRQPPRCGHGDGASDRGRAPAHRLLRRLSRPRRRHREDGRLSRRAPRPRAGDRRGAHHSGRDQPQGRACLPGEGDGARRRRRRRRCASTTRWPSARCSACASAAGSRGPISGSSGSTTSARRSTTFPR